MKTFLPALIGSALGTASVLALVVYVASVHEETEGEEVARGVAQPEALPQPRWPSEVVVRLENPVLQVEGDLRAVLESGTRMADMLSENAHARGDAANVSLAQGRGAPSDEAVDKWASFQPLPSPDGIVLQDWGPLTYMQLADGSLLYRGEQVRNEDGDWIREGRWEAWHENGVRDELGAYRNGVEHGPWEWWYENGNRMSRGTFKDGLRIGRWTFWHEGGELGMSGQYDAAGNATGTWTYYHPNGKKASEGEMVDDEPEGRWTSWEEDGSVNLERSGVYVRGERVSR